MTNATTKTMHATRFALMASTVAAALALHPPAASATGYATQSLNVPGAATRMSDNGAIVGNYVSKCTTFNYGPHEKGTYCYWAPWFYNGKNVTKLSNLWSNTRSTAADINDSLQLTGSDGTGAWTYAGGALAYMTGGGTPVAVNNAGVVAGYAPNANLVSRAIRFTNGVGTEVLFNDPFLSLSTTSIWTADINDNGSIAGWYKDTGNLYQSYVVDTNGTTTLIPNLGGATPVNCQPTRISEANPTTGQVWVAGNCSGRAFIYELTSGTLTELANLPGASNLNVSSINSSGVATGTTTLPGGVATVVMWPAGATSTTVPTDLNANQAIATGTLINLRAIDIDAAGAILIDYLDSQYNRNTVLLQPVP